MYISMETQSVREARLRLGMSQEALGKALGITQSQVSRLESKPNLWYRFALSALEKSA